MKFFLKLLGNPQNKLRVVHIAGTSGKGSTAHLVSNVLKGLGFSVGLHVSPHLVDVRERLQINGKLLSKKEFISHLNALVPYIRKLESSKYGMPSYFEIFVALAYWVFYKKKVGFAVIETGLGGQFDATNTVSSSSKLAVLSKIGIDHIEILGKSLDKVARQKALIIQRGNRAISTWQKPKARAVIEEVAKKRQSRLSFVKRGVHIKRMRCEPTYAVFDFAFEGFELKDLRLGLSGPHQVENCALALAAVRHLSEAYHFTLKESAIRKALARTSFPGRMEVFWLHSRDVVIDGAHNPQKMSAFIKGLSRSFPLQQFDFLIAFKEGKNFRKMLTYILPFAHSVTATSFVSKSQDLEHHSVNPEEIKKGCQILRFSSCNVVPDPKEALKQSLLSNGRPLVITGSLYLISELYPYIRKLKKSGLS